MSLLFTRKETKTLSLAASPPVFAVQAAGVMHLLATGVNNRGAVHVVLNASGEVVSDPLPLSVTSVNSCGPDLIVTGIADDRGIRRAMMLDAKGKVRWETSLPIPVTGLVWALPTCVEGQAAIVWEIEKESDADFGIVSLKDGVLGPVASSLQHGIAFNLNVVTIGASVYVLRGKGVEREADLLRIEGGRIVAQAATLKNAHAVVALGENLVVLSWTNDRVLLQWIDSSLKPLGRSKTIASVQSPSWIRFAWLHADGEDRLAVSYEIAAAGELMQLPNGRSEPSETSRLFVGCYDEDSETLAGVVEVSSSGTVWYAGSWLGNRFFLVHGAVAPVLSIFALDRNPA